MANAPITTELVRRGRSISFETLPEDVVKLATLCLLDYIGVTLAGGSDPGARLVREYAICEGASGPCSLIGYPEQLNATQAALVNGTAGHALDYDDVHLSLPGHVSVTILPALMALAEARNIAPKRVIASFVAGYEAGCRVGLLVAPGHYGRGFHATGTVGSCAAAFACAHLLELDEQRMINAVGIGATQASGFKAQFGTMCKALHAGKAAQNGVFSALLAERGFDSTADILGTAQGFADATSSDCRVDAALAPALHGFHLCDNLFKFHASCYGTHGLIEAVRKLRDLGVLDATSLISLTVQVGAVNERMCNIQQPRNSLEAKFSMSLMAAYALNGMDTARLDAFEVENFAKPEVVAAHRKVTIVPKPALSMTEAIVTADLVDGRNLSAEHDASLPDHNIDRLKGRLGTKFSGLSWPVLGEAKTKSIIEDITDFIKLKSVRELSRLLRAA